MAPWYWAKTSFYMTKYTISTVTSAAHGTVVAETLEDSFQVEEKGELQGEKAAYLLGRKGGLVCRGQEERSGRVHRETR